MFFLQLLTKCVANMVHRRSDLRHRGMEAVGAGTEVLIWHSRGGIMKISTFAVSDHVRAVVPRNAVVVIDPARILVHVRVLEADVAVDHVHDRDLGRVIDMMKEEVGSGVTGMW